MSENFRALMPITNELHEKLRAIASEHTLSCKQIQQFAAENRLALESMRSLVESAGITILGCSGACS